MSRKILRRCMQCKKFHAAYLVEDAKLGKCYLCYSCWKARPSQITAQTSTQDQEDGHQAQEQSPGQIDHRVTLTR